MGSLERVLEQDVARKGDRGRTKNDHVPVKEEEGDEIDILLIPEDEKDLEGSPMAVGDAAYDDDADDDLLDLGVRMGKITLTERVGGFVRPKIGEELTATLNNPKNDRASPEETAPLPGPPTAHLPLPASFLGPGPTYMAPSANFLFSSSNQSASLMDFLPSKVAADRLMQQYWIAVHCLARLVHRPTFQRRYDTFWAEIQMGIEPPGSVQAIVFAAMLSAVVSMSEDTILRDFGVAKPNLVENFQMATERALTRANFLRTTKVETLQGFVMYMIPLCRREMSRAHSTLCGSAIRLAECMGLHRDGSEYGLTPLETHVRRLIWYQLCFLDVRTCEAQGPNPFIRKDDFDTKLPLNVDDADFELRLPITDPSSRWTDMTFSLIRMECLEMQRQIWVDGARLDKRKISLTAVVSKIEDFRRTMQEKYLPMIDDSIPIQHCGHLVMNVLVHKLHIVVLNRYHSGVAKKIPDRLRQIILTSGTKVLEDAMELETSPFLERYAWYAGAYQQYHTALLLVLEVFAYPMRKEADRIWKCLDYVFEVPTHLPRDQKARLILTELRDKMNFYRDVRKIRAPTGMIERLGQLHSIDSEYSPTSLEILVAARQPSDASNYQFHGFANGEMLFAPPPANNSPEGSSEAGSNQLLGCLVSADPEDSAVTDIDWSEWDKLFPPDTNTGKLNLAPFS
ncbi:fungal specific transcription factor domain-containing protein [Lasallia pustulata]|nr:fungal specific transcription factor domain-containing protein [Lasallia pustulata]